MLVERTAVPPLVVPELERLVVAVLREVVLPVVLREVVEPEVLRLVCAEEVLPVERRV